MSGLGIEIDAKHFGAQHVLGSIRLTLASGEIACILGPSGCGKTTLMSMIAGLDTDYAGQILRPDGPVAMVFQAPRLLPWRTLAQNIALIPGAGGMDRARALLDRVGLSGAGDQFPEKASLGMQRRVGLARALAIRPALILMDEPLVSLDAETATEMRRLIAETLAEAEADTGAAALISTHDRREALHLADRVIELGNAPSTVLRDRRSPLSRSERLSADAVEQVHGDWFVP